MSFSANSREITARAGSLRKARTYPDFGWRLSMLPLITNRCLVPAVLPVMALLIGGLLKVMPAEAEVRPFPASFHAEQMPITGGTQYVRVGGHGSAVLLLHGFGDTGDMWEPLAELLAKDHT